jgi:hypothetical protein
MRSMEPDRGRKSLARRGSETALPISPYSRPRTPMPKGLSEILVYACIAASSGSAATGILARLPMKGDMCCVSAPTFDSWVRKSILPKPISGTRRWSRLAIERALAGDTTSATTGSGKRR